MFFFLEQRDNISCEGLTEGCLRLQEEKGCGGKLQGQEEEAGGASLGLFIPHPFLWILGLCTFHDSFPSFSSWSRKAISEWPWQFCLGEGGGADPCHRRADPCHRPSWSGPAAHLRAAPGFFLCSCEERFCCLSV